MPGATISFSTKSSAGASVAEGLLLTLTDSQADPASKARAAQAGRAILGLAEGDEMAVTRALAAKVSTHTLVEFDARRHPRDRRGKFAKALDALPTGSTVSLPDGTSVAKAGDSRYVVGGATVTSAGEAATKALDASVRSTHPQSLGGAQPYSSFRSFEHKEQNFFQRHPVAANVVGGGAVTAAFALFASEDGTLTPTGIRVLNETLEIEERVAADASPAPGPSQARMNATPGPKAKARGGKGAVKAAKAKGQPNTSFEDQHPRGRGGVWIKKGAGMGSGGGDQQVAHLQTRLQQLGYGPGASDGKFGDLTAQAVTRFQQTYGLQPTGQIDPATLQTLQTPPPQTLAQVQAQNRAVAALPNAQGQLPHTAAAGAGGVQAPGAVAPGAAAAPVPTPTTAAATTTGAAHPAGTIANSLNTADPNAVKQFQAAHGLTADGIVGPNTQAMMRGSGVTPVANTPKASSTGGTGAGRSTGAHSGSGRARSRTSTSPSNQPIQLGTGVGGNANPRVKAIQTSLEQIGYDLGGPDGRFGPDTKKAVVKLQRKYGLKPDGVVGPRTQKLINRLVKRAAKPNKGVTDAASQQLLQSATDEQLRHRLSQVPTPAPDPLKVLEGAIVTIPHGETRLIEGVAVRRDGLRFTVDDEPLTLKFAAEAVYDEVKHPRGRAGKWIASLTHDPGTLLSHTGRKIGAPGDLSDDKTRYPHFHAEIHLQQRMGEENVTTALDSMAGKLANMSDSQVAGLSPDELNVAYDALHKSVKPTHAKQSERLLSTIRRRSMRQARIDTTLEEFFGGLRAAYDEHKHPRGRGGKWIAGAGGVGGRPAFDVHTPAGPRKERPAFSVHDSNAPHHDFGKALGHDVSSPRLDKVTATSHPAPDRPDITPEKLRSASPAERKIMLQHARDHVANVEFRHQGEHIEHIGKADPGTRATTLEHVASAHEWEKRLRRSAESLREELRVVIPDLARRLEEAIERRVAAVESKAPKAIIEARAREVTIAGMMMEGQGISDAMRKAHATVTRKVGGKTQYKFPIPPGDKGHAKAALAYLNSSDLSDSEKKKVRAKAKATLAEAELLESLDDDDRALVQAADSLAKASTPEPFSTSKTSNWVARGGGLPPYIQHIAHDLVEKRGKSESEAIGMAIGIVKRWARGGGKVDANTRAAASKALAQWESLKAKAHGS